MTTKTRTPAKAKTTASKAATKPRTTRPKAATEPAAPPAPVFGGSLTIDVALLKKVIACVAPAASTDEARPPLTQLRLEPGDNGTTDFVATDSYRLHNVTATIACAEGSSAVNLPAWWLARWARTKYARSAKATITWTTTAAGVATATISVDLGDVTETVRLLQGDYIEYPKWRPMIAAAAERTGQFAMSAFNPRYLAQTLAACEEWSSDYSPVVLDPLKPCLFWVRHPGDGFLRCLLMPVRSTDTAPVRVG